MHLRLTLLLALILASLFQTASLDSTLADRIQLRQSNDDAPAAESPKELHGEILVEAQDGGVLFLRNDGQLMILQPGDIADKVKENAAPPPISQEEFSKQLLEELPEGFKIHKTKHYLVAYETERAYAKWIGNLYEGKLKKSFKRFWKNRKFRIKAQEPDFPLVAIVFSNKASFTAWVQRELGQPPGDTLAYYNLMTNRVAMYDLTAGRRNGAKGDRDFEAILRDPRSIPMVTTIIHEGTHQLMFNTGLQTRLADTPYWLNEGIAMFFETPDFKKKQGWRGPGKTNFDRLGGMLRYAKNRPKNSLETLIATDKRLQTGGLESANAYAESWAMIHFLINRKPAKFTQYLKHLAEKKRDVIIDPNFEINRPQMRIDDFKKFFGEDLAKLDAEFLVYIKTLK